MKKTILVVMLIIVLAITGCKAPEEVSEQVTEPTTQVQETAKELVSNLKCTDGSITGTLTNTGSGSIDVLKDVKVLLRGMAVAPTLLACEKSTLAAGESTKCLKLNGVYPIADTNRIVIRVTGDEIIKDVKC
ncbi:hypothetical protein KY331_00145 [Candidatus Woesearchaeota archaeon]|nr:hypothetical protein [Candidatus Woesearchaeota archaeon]